ncbi:arylsulfatase A-like enzyme [Kribbella rubisoli]|uniref:Arylsulfatase A-like enzyme n=1 Tax=Kribbella rubisoli TaxID=3075929 RepID=A0A4Q7WV21_9ACTN|nr:sulfatase-like hydrolase/transferase [Kribbella rubisoli]RZU14284.1 arylsulfatase A-like enzyme [Kribbella rubisoli]
MRPDIVIVMTDQQRVGLTRRSGYPVDTMPFVDGLAAAGTDFRRAYTAAPACVPARTSLLTGRFPSAHQVRQNSNARHARFSEDLLDVLRAADYQLHFAGKPHMHRGAQDFDTFAGPYFHTRGPERDADEKAFDDWLEHLDHGVSDEPTPYDVRCQLPHRITTDALEAARTADPDKPGLFWVSYPEPHNPYQVPQPYFDLVAPDHIPDRIGGPEATETKGGTYAWLRELQEEKRPGYDDNWRRYAANYLGMLRLLDDQIRRLHEGLRQRPRLTILLADHGDYVGEYGLQRKGAGLNDFLMRIPLIMTGDGIAIQQRDEPVSIVDVLPTICEAVGRPIPDGVQGRSLLPLAQGEAAPETEFGSIVAEQGFGGRAYDVTARPPLHFAYDGPTFDELNTVTQSGAARMLRSGNWKLIVHADLAGELYDVDKDPAELDNLFDDDNYLAVRAQLLHQLARWQARLTDDLPNGNYVPLRLPHNWRWAQRRENQS